jgi:rRNA-processing protein FCF1
MPINNEITNLKRKNDNLDKQRKCAWGKYYGETQDRHKEQLKCFNELKLLNDKLTSAEDKDTMPQFVINEINELYKTQKKKIECPICLENLDKFTLSKCGHKYCEGCLNTLIETTNKCAICRKQLKWKKREV